MKKCLITRPEHDDTTHYLSNWLSPCIEFATKKGIKIKDLRGEKATKINATKYLNKQNPELVLLNGHGSNESVCGHNNEEIITAGKNDQLLKGAIIHAWSCKSAHTLGPKSIKAGAKTYLGYKDDFVFMYDQNSITHPTNDKTAKLFLEPTQELINSLIKGNPAKEALTRAQDLSRKNIISLLSSETSKEDTETVRYLWWNLKQQTLYGNPAARIIS